MEAMKPDKKLMRSVISSTAVEVGVKRALEIKRVIIRREKQGEKNPWRNKP